MKFSTAVTIDLFTLLSTFMYKLVKLRDFYHRTILTSYAQNNDTIFLPRTHSKSNNFYGEIVDVLLEVENAIDFYASKCIESIPTSFAFLDAKHSNWTFAMNICGNESFSTMRRSCLLFFFPLAPNRFMCIIVLEAIPFPFSCHWIWFLLNF